MGYHFHFSFDTFLLSLNPSFAASYIPTPGARALFYSYLHGQTPFPKLRLIHPPSRSRARHLLHPIFSFAIPATAIFKVNSRFRWVSAPTDAGAAGWKIYALFLLERTRRDPERRVYKDIGECSPILPSLL